MRKKRKGPSSALGGGKNPILIGGEREETEKKKKWAGTEVSISRKGGKKRKEGDSYIDD